MTQTSKYKDAAEERLASASSKQRNALNHFQCFPNDYLPQIGEDVVEAEGIPWVRFTPEGFIKRYK